MRHMLKTDHGTEYVIPHIRMWNPAEGKWSLKPHWNLSSLLFPLLTPQVPRCEELPWTPAATIIYCSITKENHQKSMELSF